MIIAERNAKEKRTGQISADALAKFAILFLVCEVREIADIGIQQIECRFFLDGGQAFQPLANLVVGHMGCTGNQITQQCVCGNIQSIQKFNNGGKAGFLLATLYHADIVGGKLGFFRKLFQRQPMLYTLLP